VARQERRPPGFSPVLLDDSRELQRQWAAATRLSGWAEAPGCVLHRRCARWRGRWQGLCPQAAAMRLESRVIAHSADQRQVARQEPHPPGFSSILLDDSRELQRHWAAVRGFAVQRIGNASGAMHHATPNRNKIPPKKPPQNTPAEPRPSGSGITTKSPPRKSQGTWHLHGRSNRSLTNLPQTSAPGSRGCYGTHGTNRTHEKRKSERRRPPTGPHISTTDFQSVGHVTRPISIGRFRIRFRCHAPSGMSYFSVTALPRQEWPPAGRCKSAMHHATLHHATPNRNEIPPKKPPQNTPAEPRPSGSEITTKSHPRKSQGAWHLHGRSRELQRHWAAVRELAVQRNTPVERGAAKSQQPVQSRPQHKSNLSPDRFFWNEYAMSNIMRA